MLGLSTMKAELSTQNTKAWEMPQFDGMELFRAKSIHHTYTRHSHETFSIGVIQDGVGGNYYRGSTHLAPPYSIIFMDPDEVHTGYSAHNLPLTYRMLYPSPSLMRQLALDMGTKGVPHFRKPVVQDEKLAKRSYGLHCVLEQPRSALEQESLLVEILCAAIAQHADIQMPTIRVGREQRIVNQLKEYLQANFSSNISLEQLVKLTNLNRSYLIPLFRSVVGLPPYVYLTQIRVEKAKQLLVQGESV